jgi:hypothetical protein
MSKITPKNLSYDTTLPPFLARLQAANTSSREGRHEFHIARPKKARNEDAEAEDEPVYFDEGTGETLSKKEWEEKEKADEEGSGGGNEAGAGVERDGGANKDGLEGGGNLERKESKEKVATIGGSKKRKAGKVIGVEDDGEQKSVAGPALGKKAQRGDGKKGEKVEIMKKRKKIKLSFGDDD